MNSSRSDASAASLNGKLYICGGFNGQECVNTAECYDPANDIWTLLAPMSSRRSGVGVVSLGRFLYVVGGYNGTERLNTCERYDPDKHRWETLTSMMTPRSNFGIEVNILVGQKYRVFHIISL